MSNRRFYWIKLKSTFMSSDSIDFLMSQKEGANYVVLYQMICMMCINTEGLLQRQLNEVIVPYDIQKIQRDTKYFTIDTVRVALELYKNLGLIYENQDGVLAITNFDEMVGSETQSTLRSRKSREQKALQCNTNATQMQQKKLLNCNIEKEIDIEIDKEIDKDKRINNISSSKKSKYGTYKNVTLTNDEYEKLKKEYPNYEKIIEYLDTAIEMKGYKYKSCYLAIKKWVVDAVNNKNPKQQINALPLPQWQIDEQKQTEVIDDEIDLELKEELKKRLRNGV